MNGGVALTIIDPEAKKLAGDVVGRQEKFESDHAANHEKAMDDAAKDATKD
jgi:hypothetical protein